MIRKPEQLILTLCKWVERHASRGETHCLNVTGTRYSIVNFRFDIWDFPKCSPSFFLELSAHFTDRIVTIDEVCCEQCQKEIQQEINTLIINAHGIPPEEEE